MLLILTVAHLNFVFPLKKEIWFLPLPYSHCLGIAGASTQTVGVVSNQLFFLKSELMGCCFWSGWWNRFLSTEDFFFSYASLLKRMLPCRDNRVAAGQNMTEPHKLNMRKTDFIRFGKVIYVSEHVSLWQYLSVLDETTQSTIVQFITFFWY